jgi:site-specific recombinase XerD
MTRKTFRRIIVTPELLEQVNKENIKLRDSFLKEKKTRSSATTIEGYLSDLNIFFCWCVLYCDNIRFVDFRKLQIAEFFGFCADELGFGSARYGRMKSCLSSFSNFIEKFYDQEYPNFRNIILKSVESMPKNPTRDKTVLSEEEVDFIFRSLEENEEHQVSCWFALAIASGCRFAELLRFSLDLVDPNKTAFDGIFLETTKSIKTKGRGRQGKMLVKYILKDIFLGRYNTWLIERQKVLDKNNIQHNFLFIKKNGEPADDSTARGWVNKIQKYVSKPFYAHSLRHNFTTRLAKAGLPTELIQDIGGWSSEGMVKIYNDLEIKDRTWKELENLKSKPEDNSSN